MQKIDEFKKDASRLFDISKCKCVDMAAGCKCSKQDRVPPNEREFLQDQRGPRRMVIGGIDEKETSRLKKRLARKESQSNCKEKKVVAKPDVIAAAETIDSTTEDEKSDEDYMPRAKRHCKSSTDTSETNQMTVRLPSLAKACDRTGVSDRSAAIIATSVLQDLGVVSPKDTSKIIDRSKIRRERSKVREELQRSSCNVIEGLYFDGRKDKTMTVIHDVDDKYHRKSIMEEHISIVSEPGSSYFGHATPSSGSSKSITEAIVTRLKLNDVSTNDVKVIGCDGTNVNTGHTGGVIRQLEEKFEHSLQWFVCLLHANELPLRHLIQHLDGSTTGPRGFSGPIGRALGSCTEQPVDAFEPIKLAQPLPDVDVKDLSTDQQYLRLMCEAVDSGQCPLDLATRNPGLLNHSRWLTTANRILRLYVSCSKPSRKLTTIATYIMLVYAPMWFEIKMKSSCKDGARHFYQMVKKSRYLDAELKKVVDPVLQRNAFFAHPENMLLAMITDERPHIRELGLRRILKARTLKSRDKGGSIRQFRIPKLNFDADMYETLIDWSKESVTEPPVMTMMSDDELTGLIVAEMTPSVLFPKFPCHTQAVERCVKVVTEASAAVCDEKSRDGFIRTRLASRELMPTLESKRDFHL